MPVSDQAWEVVFVEDLDSAWVVRTADFFNTHFPGVFGELCHPELFRWKLGRSNPAGEGILAVAVSGVDVVGVMTATMKLIAVDGKSLLAAFTGDTFTHPAFRRAGRAKTLAPGTYDLDHYLNKSVFGRLAEEVTQRLVERGVEFVYTTPNYQSRPAYSRRGLYAEAPLVSSRSWHRPCRALFESRLPFRSGRMLQKLVDAVTWIFRPGRRVRPTIDSFALTSTDPLAEFYEAIDDVWDHQKLEGKFTLVQDSDYFAYRYASHPSQSFVGHLVTVLDKPVGFFVTRRLTRLNGYSTVCIADWLLSPDQPSGLFASLLHHVMANTEGVHTVSLWSNDREVSRQHLLRLGFLPLRTMPVLIRTNEFGRHLQTSGRSWAMPIGWSDNV